MKIDENRLFIFSSDIETIIISKDEANIHMPIVISLTNQFKTKVFSIKESVNIEENSSIMMSQYITYIKDYGEENNIIYFHNMANFDGYFILKSLIDNRIQPKIINRFNKILSIEFEINNKYYKIIDSYLIIPYSLKRACEIYNKILKKTDFNFNAICPNKINIKTLEKLKKHCKNDSEALYELITEYNKILIKEFHLPIYSSITMSSYSYHLFFKQYYDYPFYSLNSKEDEYIRKAYFGGMVEIYKPYGLDVINLDINSAYPHIMNENKFPIKKPIFKYNLENIEKVLEQFPNSFIKCEVICDVNNYYPILPYRENNKSKLLQPTGQWIGTYWSDELKYALSTGYYKIKPISLYYYDDMEYIFNRYITKLYELRKSYIQNNDKPGELLTKKLMNTLYGRTAITTDNYDIKIQTTDEYFNTDFNIIQVHTTSNDTVITINKPYKSDDNDTLTLKILKARVDWAAIITAKARIEIHKLITTPNLTVYYTDTDSIFIDRHNISLIQNKISKELGDLKIIDQSEEPLEALFIAPKTYILKNKNKSIFKMKGLSSDDHKLSNEEIYNIFKDKLKKESISTISIKDRTINFYKNIKKLSIEQKVNKNTRFSLEFTKRTKIYNDNNIWIDTKPINIIENTNISNLNFKRKDSEISKLIESINLTKCKM